MLWERRQEKWWKKAHRKQMPHPVLSVWEAGLRQTHPLLVSAKPHKILVGGGGSKSCAYFIDGKNEDTADISNLFKVSKLKVFWFVAFVSTCPRNSFKNEQRRKAARILLWPSKCCGKTRSGGRSSLLFPGTLRHNPTISLTPATAVGLLSSQLSRPMWEPAEHLLNFRRPRLPFPRTPSTFWILLKARVNL